MRKIMVRNFLVVGVLLLAASLATAQTSTPTPVRTPIAVLNLAANAGTTVVWVAAAQDMRFRNDSGKALLLVRNNEVGTIDVTIKASPVPPGATTDVTYTIPGITTPTTQTMPVVVLGPFTQVGFNQRSVSAEKGYVFVHFASTPTSVEVALVMPRS